jgi:hypothetical protein
MAMVVECFDVYSASLDPAIGTTALSSCQAAMWARKKKSMTASPSKLMSGEIEV